MKVEIQGHGTYEYTCHKPGCYHCFLLDRQNYIPILNTVIEPKIRQPKAVIPIITAKAKNSVIRRVTVWTAEQISILKENWLILSRRQLEVKIGKGEAMIKKKANELGLGVKNKIHELNPAFIKQTEIVDDFGGWF